MKIIEDEGITIFLPSIYIKSIDLKSKKSTVKLINKITDKYGIKLNNYIEVKIYIDKFYGIIIKLQKDDLDYFDYFSSELDMNIEIIKDEFIYEPEDIYKLKSILDKFTIIKNNEKLYLKGDNISNIQIGIVLENSKILFGKEASIIKNKGKIIKKEVIKWKDP